MTTPIPKEMSGSLLKPRLKEKHKALRPKDCAGLSKANHNIKNDVIKTKLTFKQKLEHEFGLENKDNYWSYCFFYAIISRTQVKRKFLHF